MAANTTLTPIPVVPYNTDDSFRDLGALIGSLMVVDLFGMGFSIYVQGLSLGRAAVIGGVWAGIYDSLYTWIVWGSMARANAIGGLCPAAVRPTPGLWYGTGGMSELAGGLMIAFLFIIDVLITKTFYFAYESKDKLASAALAESEFGAAEKTEGRMSAEAAEQGVIETERSERSQQQKNKQRGRESSYSDLESTDISSVVKAILISLTGAASAALYPASGDYINIEAQGKTCVAGYDEINVLPAYILIGSLVIGLISIPSTGLAGIFLILLSPLVAGIIAIAQAVSHGIRNFTVRFGRFSFDEASKLTPFTARGLFVVRLLRLILISVLFALSFTAWFKPGQVYYNPSPLSRFGRFVIFLRESWLKLLRLLDSPKVQFGIVCLCIPFCVALFICIPYM